MVATTALSVYDEAALCSSTFKSSGLKKIYDSNLYISLRILRGMVHTWLHEVSTNQNFYADLQLQHFYRYKTVLLWGH